ncbi:MAG: diacylglycerol kinase [Chloroflexota bacterium]|jgi:diacylglycerol kinase family enzyme|nr:diacylglycerol kinase [Chloroflexota bacterium]
MTKPVSAIINPGSGDGEADEIATLLRERLGDAAVHLLQPGEDITARAREEVQRGAARVVAAGGDGTIAAVAHGLMHTDTVLGVVSTGTFNNIAAALEIPEEPAAAVDVALGDTLGWITAGRVADEYFFEGAGVGLAADLFPVGEALKEGDFSELLGGAQSFMRQHAVSIDCLLEPPTPGKTLRLQALLLTISNTPTIGARLEIAPEADIREPWLYLTVYSHFGKLEAIAHFALLALRRKGIRQRIRRYPFSRATLRGADPLSVHADTKPVGEMAEVVVEAVPEAVRVAIPG